jgi:hypothetical protein
MSIVGHFTKDKPDLRMPKGKDSVGIRFEGSVSTGQKSVEHALQDDAMRPRPFTLGPGGVLSPSPEPHEKFRLESALRMHNRLPGKFPPPPRSGQKGR